MIAIKELEFKERALDVLEKAFYNSPGMLWMISPKNKKNNFRNFLSIFLEEAIVKNGAYLTSDRNGVLLFFQLQDKKLSFSLIYKKLYALFFIMGIKNGIRAIYYKNIIDAERPKSGWLGWLVATDSKVKGNLAAYEIKQFMFEQGDKTNQTVYVETTVPRVRLLYLATGYSEFKSLKHPYEDLTIWFMKREPKL